MNCVIHLKISVDGAYHWFLILWLMGYTATKIQLVVEIYTKFYLFSISKYITWTPPPCVMFFAPPAFGIHPFVESHSPMCLRSHLYFPFRALLSCLWFPLYYTSVFCFVSFVSFTYKFPFFILVLLGLSGMVLLTFFCCLIGRVRWKC